MTRTRVPTIALLVVAGLLSSCGRSADDAGSEASSTVVTSSTVETTAVVAAPTTTATPAQALTYVIQSGDSLSVIAERFRISTQELADWNSITDANSIKVGDEIRIPPATDETTTETSSGNASTTETTASTDSSDDS